MTCKMSVALWVIIISGLLLYRVNFDYACKKQSGITVRGFLGLECITENSFKHNQSKGEKP